MCVLGNSITDHLLEHFLLLAIIIILYFGRYKCSATARNKVIEFFKKRAEDIVKTGHWKKAMLNYPDLITELVIAQAKK